MNRQAAKLALEASTAGVVMVDVTGRISLVNRTVVEYFGYTREELLGMTVDQLVPTPSRLRHGELRQEFFQNSSARAMGRGMDLQGQRKNGELFPLEIGLNPIETDEGHFVIATIVDISASKKAEAAIRHAKEEAERANRMKSEFLNLMSHELRTPLTVILGNIPMLTDPAHLPSPVETAEIACDIQESSEHLLFLINDLLDISKIEAGKMDLHLADVDLADLAANVTANMGNLAAEKGLSLETDLPPLMVRADPLRLKQILLNLLSNAVKFTDQGSVAVRAQAVDGMVQITVSDTGHGIPAASLPLLFNKFKQLDSGSTRKAGGSGLGLVITRKLVELHGGHISVSSVLDQGSEFTFTIPRAGAPHREED